MKAMVVENLCEHFDVHSIAGIKMNQLLTHYPSLDQDTTIDSDEPTRSPKKKKKKKGGGVGGVWINVDLHCF